MTSTHTKILGVIVLVFFLLLMPAIGQIYHQDEYRWISEMNLTDLGPHVHPPLYFFIGRVFGLAFGFDYERWVPLAFCLANVVLVYAAAYALTRRRNIGLIAAGLFAVNSYSIIAALQIDIDGAILPFFALLTYLAYLRVLEGRKKWYWLLTIGIIGGLLAKLSFALVLAALAIDFAIRSMTERNWSGQALVRRYGPWLIAGFGVSVVAYLVLSHVMPGVIAYAEHFKIADFAKRAYLDLFFKILKSLVLLGPLLFLAGFSSLRRSRNVYRYRFFWAYLALCFLFYGVIFDFTTLTVERYFMFMIMPFAILAAEPVEALGLIIIGSARRWRLAVGALIGAGLLLALLLIPHDILPLNPKIAYAQHIISWRWNFLIPITGGSGPIGFYVSALFTACAWGTAGLALIAVYRGRGIVREMGAAVFVAVGLCTTLVIIQEFLFGGLYGSPNRIAWETVEYVNHTPAITKVITYYDIAPYDLRLSGKYYSRFYTSPTRDYTAKLTLFRGHYMIVDFPAIGYDDRYWKLITRCPVMKEFQDRRIHSYVFDCTQLP